MSIRLNKAIRELNIGLQTAVEFLEKKQELGEVKSDLNFKLSDGQYNALVGAFKNGKFDGKGVYTVSSNSETFIEPFSSNSAKLRNMTLEGVFKKGRAHGNFTASQNGTPVFIMKCEDGMIKEVKLPKKSASKTK